MQFACVPHFTAQVGKSSLRTAFLVLAAATLVSSGSAEARSGAAPVVQTAVVINGQASGSAARMLSRYTPGANPTKITCKSREEAEQLGNNFARETGAKLLLTSGTKSMEPLIHGRTYVVVQALPYSGIAKGELLVYMGRPNASRQERTCMLHRTVLQDKGGWLMCGDNNRWSESWDRVTPATYMGTVTTILEFPQT